MADAIWLDSSAIEDIANGDEALEARISGMSMGASLLTTKARGVPGRKLLSKREQLAETCSQALHHQPDQPSQRRCDVHVATTQSRPRPECRSLRHGG